ncbi:type II CRISPR RNA-guided endonuclease Cas9 [Candidatus Sumerlaeota bacterium]|nr:type II CRISPR RNA-guided endonuclease Cas9 [Candidatus Sumerlaeota bacterium]
MNFSLGLDLGPTSIGWAVVENPESATPKLVRAGVRIFPEGVDRDKKGLEVSKMTARREARQMRRQHDRRNRRKSWLPELLAQCSLYPKDTLPRLRLLRMSPWQLRAKGLDHPLTAEEFGRVMIHLNMRRGFNARRKEGNKKEASNTAKSIGELQRKIEEARCRTVGEVLAGFEGRLPLRNRRPDEEFRIINREMLEREFDLLWKKQEEFHRSLLTPEIRERIHHVIFFQRKLKDCSDKIGACELEPTEKRAARASWHAQQARMLQDINNITVSRARNSQEALSQRANARWRKKPEDLSHDERRELLDALDGVKELKTEKIRKILKLGEMDFLSLEGAKVSRISCNLAECCLRDVFGKRLLERPEFYRETVWNSLIGDDEEDFEENARGWGLTEEEIEDLFKHAGNVPDGYAMLSTVALKKILPALEEGAHFSEAKIAANYGEVLEHEVKDLLPPSPREISNPIVRKALVEVRKLVNAIIRRYGKPTSIVVEMARETRGSAKERNEQLSKNRERDEDRQRIIRIIQSHGITKPSYDDVLKYRLWEECDGLCPYSGKKIEVATLLHGNEVQIEHIIPYSRSLDDSQNNKTICHTSENAIKGQKLPWEAYGHDDGKWETFQVRIRSMKKMFWRKREKFFQKNVVLDEFISRQLNDTRYISREVHKYLKQLYPGRSDNRGEKFVFVTRGDVTSHLRHLWGLNRILNASGTGEKNREDHRHHAVDAVVVALTNDATLQMLSRKIDFKQKHERFPLPWTTFREDVEKEVHSILVSFRAQRHVRGALHEETNYGKGRAENEFVTRKKLSDLTAPMIEQIRDETIRKLVQAHVADAGDLNKALKQPLFLPNKKGDPVPIRSVRVTVTGSTLLGMKDKDGNVYRYVASGSNHHVAIFEFKDRKGKRKREGVVVTMFDAAQREAENKRRHKEGRPLLPIVRREHPDRPDAKFLFSLCINEMVRLKDKDGFWELCRVQKFSGGKSGESWKLDIFFRPHTVSTIDDAETKRRIRSLDPEKTTIAKVHVDILGDEHPAHD